MCARSPDSRIARRSHASSQVVGAVDSTLAAAVVVATAAADMAPAQWAVAAVKSSSRTFVNTHPSSSLSADLYPAALPSWLARPQGSLPSSW